MLKEADLAQAKVIDLANALHVLHTTFNAYDVIERSQQIECWSSAHLAALSQRVALRLQGIPTAMLSQRHDVPDRTATTGVEQLAKLAYSLTTPWECTVRLSSVSSFIDSVMVFVCPHNSA